MCSQLMFLAKRGIIYATSSKNTKNHVFPSSSGLAVEIQILKKIMSSRPLMDAFWLGNYQKTAS